jgi:hypothetical protein
LNNTKVQKMHLARGHILLAHNLLVQVFKRVGPDDPEYNQLADAITLCNCAGMACWQALYLTVPTRRPSDTLASAPIPKGEPTWTETQKPPSGTIENN